MTYANTFNPSLHPPCVHYYLFHSCSSVKLRQSSIPKNHGQDNPLAKFSFQSGVTLAACILDTFPIFRLIAKVISFSLETVKIVRALPDLRVLREEDIVAR